MKVSFEGIGDQIVSFVKGSGAEKGVFVKLSQNYAEVHSAYALSRRSVKV